MTNWAQQSDTQTFSKISTVQVFSRTITSSSLNYKIICFSSMSNREFILLFTLAQMAHFSIPYYFTIPNSEFRIPKSEFRILNPPRIPNSEIRTQSLETPSPSPTFTSRKSLSPRSTPMHLVYENKNILFSVYSVDNPLTNTRRSFYRRTALNNQLEEIRRNIVSYRRVVKTFISLSS